MFTLQKASQTLPIWSRWLSSSCLALADSSNLKWRGATTPSKYQHDTPERARRREIMKSLAPCYTNVEKGVCPRLPDGSRVPWTPTSQLDKRKTYKQRSQHLIQTLREEYKSTVSEDKRAFPSFKAGDVLEVQLVVPENDLRPASFVGICMGIKHNGVMTRFRVRNVIKATGPVERTFLLYSPFVKGIKVKRSIPVRRAKLTYLRKRKDAESTFS